MTTGQTLVRSCRLFALTGILSAVSLTFLFGPALAQQPPLKIGAMLPTTGVFAPNGADAIAGFQQYFDEIGNQVAGRKIELIIEDTAGRPDVAVTKARKLAEGDKVDMLTGLASSAEALALNTYVREKKIPLIVSMDAGVNELTMPGPLLNPYVVRTSQNARNPGASAADWAYKQGWRKVALIASDYAGGVDTVGGFANAFCRLGGTIAQEQYPPLGVMDVAPYLANLNRNVDGIATFIPVSDGLRLVRQYGELGLKIPIMDIYGLITFASNLTQLGDASLGIYSSLHYTPLIKTPENERFVKTFVERNKRKPGDNGPDGYVGARAIVEAVKAVNGDLTDTDKFMAALKAVKFPSPKGDVALDKYGQIIQSMYIRKVEKIDGEYENVPIATYPNQDQFWPYTAEEYATFKRPYAELKGSMTDCAKVLEKK